MDRFAVILAAYNPDDKFYVQVDSILAQRNVLLDIFIFDDGSVEHSKAVYEKYIHLDNVKLIVQCPSGSPGKNFLRALKNPVLRGYDFYAFSDQDDVWLDVKLIKASDLIKHLNVDAYSSNLSIFENGKVTGELVKFSKQKSYDFVFQGASAGCTYVFSQRLFEKCVENISKIDILRLSNSVSHDWFVYYTARINGIGWVMDNNSYILYRQHENNNFGARVGLLIKLRMLLGNWYKQNADFLRDTQPSALSGRSFIYRVAAIRYIFEFRRNKIESIVVYFLWLLRGF